MSKTEIPAASGTNITSNASAISTAASSSTAQRTFLSKYRLHKKFVAAARVLLLVAFLSVWELTASHQIIDSFIFIHLIWNRWIKKPIKNSASL